MDSKEDLIKNVTIRYPLGIAAALFCLANFASERVSSEGFFEWIMIAGTLGCAITVFGFLNMMTKNILMIFDGDK